MSTAGENLKKRFEEIQKKRESEKAERGIMSPVCVDVVLEKIQQTNVQKEQDLDEMMGLFERQRSVSKIVEVGKEQKMKENEVKKQKDLDSLIDIYTAPPKRSVSILSPRKTD